MNPIEVGNLVYIPAETKLQKYKNDIVTKMYKVKSPVDVLVMGKSIKNTLVVYFEGENWYVNERDVYLSR